MFVHVFYTISIFIVTTYSAAKKPLGGGAISPDFARGRAVEDLKPAPLYEFRAFKVDHDCQVPKSMKDFALWRQQPMPDGKHGCQEMCAANIDCWYYSFSFQENSCALYKSCLLPSPRPTYNIFQKVNLQFAAAATAANRQLAGASALNRVSASSAAAAAAAIPANRQLSGASALNQVSASTAARGMGGTLPEEEEEQEEERFPRGGLKRRKPTKEVAASINPTYIWGQVSIIVIIFTCFALIYKRGTHKIPSNADITQNDFLLKTEI